MNVLVLADLDEFANLTNDLVEAVPRSREWFNSISSENEKLPPDWASLDRTPFQKMLMVICLRPDRMNTTLTTLI